MSDATKINSLEEIHAAEKTVSNEWRKYEQTSGGDELRPGSLRCTFALEPMVANLKIGSKETSIPSCAPVLDRVVRQNLWFSYLFVQVQSVRKLSQQTPIQFLQIVTALFGNVRRFPELASTKYYPTIQDRRLVSRRLQVDALYLKLQDVRALDIEALFSALAINQTTRELSISVALGGGLLDDYCSTVILWKWLMYGVFSKRAREGSALESLTLTDITSMTTSDVSDFIAIASSDHPEEVINGSFHSQSEAATLLSYAPIYHQKDTAGLSPRKDATPLVCSAAIYPVRKFSDDGESKWVNVLIPGLGRYLVQCTDLAFDLDCSLPRGSSGLTSLTLMFHRYTRAAQLDGLPRFLATVGASLKYLTLDAPTFVLEDNDIPRACPNLHEFCRHRGTIHVRFNFKEYRARNQPLPALHFAWDDVVALASSLSDVANPIYICVRALRVCLTDHDVLNGRQTSGVGKVLENLLKMLDVNQHLEYLKVLVPSRWNRYSTKFRACHQKQIAGGTMPASEKIAFLSVVSAGSLPDLQTNKKRKSDMAGPRSALSSFDYNVISNVFEFAAVPDVREVYLECEPGWSDDDSDDDGGYYDEYIADDGDRDDDPEYWFPWL